jgi:hypothetical protein
MLSIVLTWFSAFADEDDGVVLQRRMRVEELQNHPENLIGIDIRIEVAGEEVVDELQRVVRRRVC